MSTILDALRKLEEERHSRTADARSRLLLSPTHQTRSLPLRRSPWKAKRNLASVVGLILAGFSAGASFVFWRSYSGHTNPDSVIVATSPPTGKTDIAKVSSSHNMGEEKRNTEKAEPAEANSREQSQGATPHGQETLAPTLPLADAQPTSPSASIAMEAVSDTFSPTPPSEEPDSTLTSVSVVQRSPFVATPPMPREPSPPRREVTPAAKRMPSPTPSSPDTKARDNSLYEVLLPNGTTRASKSPAPPPTNTVTPPTSSGTSLSFLQWSSDPEKRIAFLRVNGGPLTMTHEGDTIGGYTVVEIRQDAVELQSGETHITLRPH